jgi:hypothetical protein
MASSSSWRDWCDSDITDELQEIFNELKDRGFKALGNGRHRQGFLFPSGKFVLKVPINSRGSQANLEESQRCHSDYKDKGAKCRLFYYKGFPCLIMEKLENTFFTCFYPTELLDAPGWVHTVDSYQVGRNRKGKLLAYDYSYC